MSFILSPINLASSGHIGHFEECDWDDLPLDLGNDVVKFLGLSLLSQVQFHRTSNNSFTVFGPWYSLLFETAKKLNYSPKGLQAIEGSTEAELMLDFVPFQPDVVFIPFNPNNALARRALDTHFAKFSKMVYTVENDHILSAVKWKTKPLTSILAPFDSCSLFLLVSGLASISVLARFFKLKPTKMSFSDFVWNLMTALICSPQVTAKKAIWRFVGITWLLGVFLLQQLFSGDMYTAMTLGPGHDVIDNFEDLALKTSGPITIFDAIGSKPENCFSRDHSYQKELMSRLRILPMEHLINHDLNEQLLFNVSSGNQYHIGTGNILDFYQNVLLDGLFKESLYISKEFGQPVPVFITIGPKIKQNVLKAFNDM